MGIVVDSLCGSAVLSAVPVLIGPLQVLIVLFPAVVVSVATVLISLFRPGVIKLSAIVLWRQRVGVCVGVVCVLGVVWILGLLTGGVRVGEVEAGAGQVGMESDADVWAGHLGGGGVGGNRDKSAVAERGAYQWSYPGDQQGQGGVAVVTAPVAVAGDSLIVGVSGGGKLGAVCLAVVGETDDGAEQRWFYETKNGVSISAGVCGGKVFVVDGEAGDIGRRVHCVDLESGEGLWSEEIGEWVPGVFAVSDDAVFGAFGTEMLVSLDLAGERLWSQRVGAIVGGPEVGESMVVAAVEGGEVVVLDRGTGRRLWRSELEGRPVSWPVVVDNNIYVGTDVGLESLRLVDGSKREGWRFGGGGVSGDVVVMGAEAAYVSDANELVIVSLDDGGMNRRIGGVVVGTTPMVSRGSIYFETEVGIGVIEGGLEPGRMRQWADTSWLGRAATGMVVSDMRVYVGRRGWGLVCLGAGQ